MIKNYEVPEINLAALKDKIELLQRKALKLGVEPVKMTIGASRLVPKAPLSSIKIKVFTVTIEGESPKLNGWKFAATLEHLTDGNIIRKFPWHEGDIPVMYRHCKQYCDHCKTERSRKDTYIVYNEHEGYKQVGRNCLKDFTGTNDPHKTAAYAEYLMEFFDNFDEDFIEESEDKTSSGYVGLEYYLSFVVMQIEKFGFESRTKNLYGVGTCDHAWSIMCDKENKRKPAVEHLNKAKQAIAWINGLDQSELSNEYMWNLYAVSNAEYISKRDIGLAASLIPAYTRHSNKPEVNSNYVGEIGKRIDMTLKVSKIIPTPGMYGTTYITKLIDLDGNLLTWFASNLLEEGITYKGKVTIKDHQEYRGIKQTIITRCKLAEI